MLSNIGFTEILLIAVVVLVIFGPNKLPEIGRAMGKTMQEFKKGMRGLADDESESSAGHPAPPSHSTNESPTADQQRPSPEAQRKLPE
jgi:sec-independent protein translocase protein TatA